MNAHAQLETNPYWNEPDPSRRGSETFEGYFGMGAVKLANDQVAQAHWFEPATLRFFRSRVGSTLYGGRYFISSEQGPNGIRAWSIREALRDGHIQTVGEFQAYRTRSAALCALKRLL